MKAFLDLKHMSESRDNNESIPINETQIEAKTQTTDQTVDHLEVDWRLLFIIFLFCFFK